MGPAGTYIPIPTRDPDVPQLRADQKWYNPERWADQLAGWWQGTPRVEKLGDVGYEVMVNAVTGPGIEELARGAYQIGKKVVPPLVKRAGSAIGKFLRGAGEEAASAFGKGAAEGANAEALERAGEMWRQGGRFAAPQGQDFRYNDLITSQEQAINDRFNTLYRKWADQYEGTGKTTGEVMRLIKKRGLRDDVEYRALVQEHRNLLQSSERSVEGLKELWGREDLSPGLKGVYQEVYSRIQTRPEAGGSRTHELIHHQMVRFKEYLASKFQKIINKEIIDPTEIKRLDRLNDYIEWVYNDDKNMRAMTKALDSAIKRSENIPDVTIGTQTFSKDEVLKKLNNLRLMAYETTIPEETLAYNVGDLMSMSETTLEKAFADQLKNLARRRTEYMAEIERMKPILQKATKQLNWESDVDEVVTKFMRELDDVENFINQARMDRSARRELLIEARMGQSPQVARLHNVRDVIMGMSDEKFDQLWTKFLQDEGEKFKPAIEKLALEARIAQPHMMNKYTKMVHNIETRKPERLWFSKKGTLAGPMAEHRPLSQPWQDFLNANQWGDTYTMNRYTPGNFIRKWPEFPKYTGKGAAGSRAARSSYKGIKDVFSNGIQETPPGMPSLHLYTDTVTGSTFATTSASKEAVQKALDNLRKRFGK